MGLFQASPADKQAAWCGKLPPGSTCTAVCLPEGFPHTAGFEVPLPGH